MPPKDFQELPTPFISINGTKFEPLTDCTEQIEESELGEHEFHDLNGNGVFEISFDMDRGVAQKLHAALQPRHGEKLTVETSCVCDGTLVFAIQLMQSLMKMGATNINIRSEEVENPDPVWMKMRFIATGIVWNTNNFRKLHGIPMKRRKSGKSKA